MHFYLSLLEKLGNLENIINPYLELDSPYVYVFIIVLLIMLMMGILGNTKPLRAAVYSVAIFAAYSLACLILFRIFNGNEAAGWLVLFSWIGVGIGAVIFFLVYSLYASVGETKTYRLPWYARISLLALSTIICLLLVSSATNFFGNKANEINSPLFAACQKGSPQVIVTAIQSGAYLHGRDKDGKTVFIYAAEKNPNPEVIAALAKAGADVNAKDKGGWTPLKTAARYNPNPEVIAALIKAGADVNAKNENGWTPLMTAAENNSNPEVIAALVKAGADVNARDKKIGSALMEAARAGERRLIMILLDAGADPKAKDVSGKMAIDYARENPSLKDTDALKRLEEVSR